MSYIQLRDSLFFESNRCLIADPTINFDIDDIDIRNQLVDPCEFLNSSDKSCALLLDNILNTSGWLVFVKMNHINEPIHITLIAEDMFGDAYAEILDNDIYCWEEVGMIHAENYITMVDFNHFEDDDLIVDLMPNFILKHPNNCVNPWFNYVTDLGVDNEKQGYVECFPFGVIANNLNSNKMIYPIEVCRMVDDQIYAIRLYIGDESPQSTYTPSFEVKSNYLSANEDVIKHESMFNIKDNYISPSETGFIPLRNISELYQTNLEEFFKTRRREEEERVNSSKLKEI